MRTVLRSTARHGAARCEVVQRVYCKHARVYCKPGFRLSFLPSNFFLIFAMCEQNLLAQTAEEEKKEHSPVVPVYQMLFVGRIPNFSITHPNSQLQKAVFPSQPSGHGSASQQAEQNIGTVIGFVLVCLRESKR